MKLVIYNPKIAKSKKLSTLFILSNFACLYKIDLLIMLRDIFPEVTQYYLNRIIRILITDDYIGSAASSSPRRKIYYLKGKGWSTLRDCFDIDSEDFIRFSTLEKTTRPRCAKVYREEQAVFASICNLFYLDYFPFNLPAVPGRDELDSNLTGRYIDFVSSNELDGKSFFMPWYLFKSDNAVSLKNNAIAFFFSIKDGYLNCLVFFNLYTGVNSNFLYKHTEKIIKQRIEDFCFQYQLKIKDISYAIALDIANLQDYSASLKDVFFAEKEKDIIFLKDRYGDNCELLRYKKHFRLQNNNIDYIALYSSSAEINNDFLSIDEIQSGSKFGDFVEGL